MENFELPYGSYMESGRAWSPTWTDTPGGFDAWLVLAPPEVETIDTAADYFTLLARRIEHHLEDWLDRYGDELPMRVDLDDPAAVKAGTIEMIRQYLPDVAMGLSASQSNRSIADAIAQPEIATRLTLTDFPIVLPPRLPDDGWEDCISETSLKGWLLQVS